MICLVFVGASISVVEGMAKQCLRNWSEHLSFGIVRARRALSEEIGQSHQRASTTLPGAGGSRPWEQHQEHQHQPNNIGASSCVILRPAPAAPAVPTDVVREVLAARSKGPWVILGIMVGDWHGIRVAYRQRLLGVHPDKTGNAEGSEEAFNVVRCAYADSAGCL